MTIEDRNGLAVRIQMMASVAPVVIVIGNHDVPGDLNVLERLARTWQIVVVTSPQIVELDLAPSRTLRAAIACIPYPSKALLVAAGTPHDRLHAAATAALDTIFMELSAQLAEARAAGRLTLAIGHVAIGGAIASVGQPQIGTELEIGEGHLARLGDCPKLFNHIHKHQRVGSARYAGSLCRTDWGETEPKGYLRVMCKPRERQGGTWAYVVEFVELPVPSMYHIDGTLTRDGFEWRAVKGPDGQPDEPPPSWAGCDIRVRVRYASRERDVLAEARARIQETFAGARRLEIEPIAVPDRALRAPEVVEARTLDEKLRAWAKLLGATWSDAIAACAAELQVNDETALVAQVIARLGPLADLGGKEKSLHDAVTHAMS